MQRDLARNRLEQETAERHIRTIAETSNRLALLANDLLDVARLQSGHFPILPQPTSLARIVRQTIAEWRASAPGHRLDAELDEDLPLELDPERIRQVVANLVENAIKYSPQGGTVRIRLRYNGDGASLTVQDQGIGLAETALASIFEPFGRAANSTASNIPGMGLGLYICRRIVMEHGGRLWAESDGEGHGTTMAVWLPVTGGRGGT